jgi:hypothetical protein
MGNIFIFIILFLFIYPTHCVAHFHWKMHGAM